MSQSTPANYNHFDSYYSGKNEVSKFQYEKYVQRNYHRKLVAWIGEGSQTRNLKLTMLQRELLYLV